MLGPRSLFPWFTLFLVVNKVAALSSSDLFNLPSTSSYYGACTSYMTRLNNFVADFQTLAEQMKKAVETVEAAGHTDQKEVAQQLFTAWFGIQFDVNKNAVKSESQTAWTAVTGHIQRLQNLISNDGTFPSFVSPANLFCGDFGEVEAWNTFMMDTNGNFLDPVVSIEQIYGDWAAQIPESLVPYYVPSIEKYYLLSPTIFSASQMCTTLDGMNSYGSPYASGYFRNSAGYDVPVERDQIPDFVLICPGVLTSTDGNVLLGDIGLLPLSTDISARTQLSAVKPKSTVMLHEILHMVTRWDSTGNAGVIADGQTKIVDHSYLMLDCLIYASQESSQAYLNTENYVHFAVAWWYYNSRTDWQGTTPATFYAGYLQTWTRE